MLKKSTTKSIKSRASSRKSIGSRKSGRSSRFWNTSYIERKSRKEKSQRGSTTKKKKGTSIGSRKSKRSGKGKSDFKTKKKRRGSRTSSVNSFGWSEDSLASSKDSFQEKHNKFRQLRGKVDPNRERNKIALINAKMLKLKMKRNQMRKEEKK